MRGRSVALRLERLHGRRATVDLEHAVRDLAAEYGLHPAQVRAELHDLAECVRRFGVSTPAQAIERWAEEFSIREAELCAEVVRVTDKTGIGR